MRKMMFILIVLFQAGLNGYSQAEKGKADRYLFDEVVIEGSTNMNRFHLNYRERHYSAIPETAIAEDDRFRILIPARDIMAESKLMRQDFLRMINAREYPFIYVALDEDIAARMAETSSLTHRIGLTLNGIARSYTIRSGSAECYPGQWCLTGNLKVKLSDFNIELPKKMFGLVKVNDEVFINFRILFSTAKN
ncbi:MAG: YceI family protein [Prolixibacteraceae bacterium]